MEVVINKCHGGFGLSDEAIERCVELGMILCSEAELNAGVDADFFAWEAWRGMTEKYTSNDDPDRRNRFRHLDDPPPARRESFVVDPKTMPVAPPESSREEDKYTCEQFNRYILRGGRFTIYGVDYRQIPAMIKYIEKRYKEGDREASDIFTRLFW